MSWYKAKVSDDNFCNATEYCQNTDHNHLGTWVKENDIVSFCFPFLQDEDIPKLLKTGRLTFGFKNTVSNPGKKAIHLLDYFDHGVVYKRRDGKCCLVFHTYNYTEKLAEAIRKWCYDNDLKEKILPYSWYNPGATTCVMISCKEG